MKPGREVARHIGSSVVTAFLLLGISFSAIAESPANRSAIEGRHSDYRRMAPGVPQWPSTCDCISIGFGLKDSSGYQSVRFRFANAAEYYGQDAYSTEKVGESIFSTKGPLKELVQEEAPSVE